MKYLSVRDLAERYGVSVATIWNWAGEGPYKLEGFPKPVKLGPQIVRFDLSLIESWETMKKETN